MRIVALDLSLASTGVATSDGMLATINTTRKPHKFRGPQRLMHIRDAVMAYVTRPEQADLVLLEDYAYSRGNQAHAVGELGGVIRLALWEGAIRYVLVGTGQLKKYALGKGGGPNTGKDAMLIAAMRRFGFTGKDNDQADALILLRMGQHMYRQPGRVNVPKTHSELLHKIDWPEFRDPNRDAVLGPPELAL